MKRFKKFLAMVVCTALLITAAPVSVPASVERVETNVIVIDGKVYNSDFKEFLIATRSKTVKHWEIIIHSPGGDAFSTVAIMNRMNEMKRNGVTFTTKVYGLGMSAGTYIWMMGDERIMYEGSSLMFHSIEAQKEQYQRDQAAAHQPKVWNMVLRMDEFIREMLRNTGMSDSAVAHWMDSGKAQFMSAETAYNIGIATKYIPLN